MFSLSFLVPCNLSKHTKILPKRQVFFIKTYTQRHDCLLTSLTAVTASQSTSVLMLIFWLCAMMIVRSATTDAQSPYRGIFQSPYRGIRAGELDRRSMVDAMHRRSRRLKYAKTGRWTYVAAIVTAWVARQAAENPLYNLKGCMLIYFLNDCLPCKAASNQGLPPSKPKGRREMANGAA